MDRDKRVKSCILPMVEKTALTFIVNLKFMLHDGESEFVIPQTIPTARESLPRDDPYGLHEQKLPEINFVPHKTSEKYFYSSWKVQKKINHEQSKLIEKLLKMVKSFNRRVMSPQVPYVMRMICRKT